MARVNSYAVMLLLGIAVCSAGCAPVAYSVVIVGATDAIDEAKAAGASCTEQQLAERSPVTKHEALKSGVELASTEESSSESMGSPRCAAPFEYYSALEFLSKAREEVGYSDYQAALEYARESRLFAQKARDISLMAGKETAR